MAANCTKVTGIKTHSVVEEAHDWLLVWICHWLGIGLQEGDRLAWAKRDWFQSQWLASTWWSTQVAFWKTVWWICQDPDSCNWELFHNMLTVPQSQSQSANVAGFELEESQSSCTPRARLGSKKNNAAEAMVLSLCQTQTENLCNAHKQGDRGGAAAECCSLHCNNHFHWQPSWQLWVGTRGTFASVNQMHQLPNPNTG